jgi:hypothetical protein
MAVKCGLFPPLNGKSFERYLDPPSPNGCGELSTMIGSIKFTRMWPFQQMFKEINVGWPRHKNRTSYPKDGTRKLFWRRKASGETSK